MDASGGSAGGSAASSAGAGAAPSHANCRELSRAYLECRMQRGLMAPEDLDSLGFSAQHVVVPESPAAAAAAAAAAPKERIAGLGAAKKQGGFLFGIGGGSTGVRGGGGHG